MVWFEACVFEQRVGEGHELSVVAVGMVDIVDGLATIPCLGLLLIRRHRTSSVGRTRAVTLLKPEPRTGVALTLAISLRRLL